MLDVHPPHHAANTWRDFFTHIATIVVGLLIAVGLEQTVEYVHHRREGAELRERLHAESMQILQDAHRAEAAQIFQKHWLEIRLEEARSAVWQHKPLPPQVPDNRPYFANPDIPQWRAAQSSGLTARLTSAEITGYAEVEYVQTRLLEFEVARRKAEDQVRVLNRELPSLPGGEPDFQAANPQFTLAYLQALSAEADGLAHYLDWVRIAIGAEDALTNGKFDLEVIYRAERNAAYEKGFYSPHEL